MSRSEEQINPKNKNRYSVIPRVLIFLFKGNDVLLIKGSPEKKLWPGKYNGLGGHIEKGEDPLSAARRELLEESGLKTTDFFLCGTIIVDTGGAQGVAIYLFRGEFQSGAMISSPEGSLEWVNSQSLDNLNIVEDLQTLIPRIKDQKAEFPPFSAKYFYDSSDNLQIIFAN